jgi:Cft2 family RNA processing exonuclease
MNQRDVQHHTLPGTGVLIDGFRFARHDLDVTAFFLTHFHSDHYGGLDDGFPWGNRRGALLYCSEVTADLAVSELGVDRSRTVVCRFGVTVAVPEARLHVTFLPANHCPGAAMLLFRRDDDGRTVLHTGDMRFDAAMLAYPALVAARAAPAGIDEVLLDTTYAHPKHRFAPQADRARLNWHHIDTPHCEWSSGRGLCQQRQQRHQQRKCQQQPISHVVCASFSTAVRRSR